MKYVVVSIFMVLDYLSGVIKAVKNKELSSKKMRDGLLKKCGNIIALVLGALIDYAQLYVDVGIHIPAANAICAYIIVMEVVSVLENVEQINNKILPGKIKEILGGMKEWTH